MINLNKKSLLKWFENLEFKTQNYYDGWHWERVIKKDHTDNNGKWFHYKFKRFKNGELEVSHITAINKLDNKPLTKYEIYEEIRDLNKKLYGY